MTHDTNPTEAHASPNDQSERAALTITEALFAEQGAISHATARLIAASIHSGPGSALEHLASTGQFDRDQLREEVAGLAVPAVQTPWRDALLAFASTPTSTHPWARSSPSAARNRRPLARIPDETSEVPREPSIKR